MEVIDYVSNVSIFSLLPCFSFLHHPSLPCTREKEFLSFPLLLTWRTDTCKAWVAIRLGRRAATYLR